MSRVHPHVPRLPRKPFCLVALRRQEYAFDGLEYLPLGYVYAEEGMEEETYDSGSHTKCDYQRRDVSQGLLEPESKGNEQKPVARIAHTEGEEEHEEHGDEGRRVETIVCRAAVHVGEQLEHLHETVVPELDGRVVGQSGIILQVEDIRSIQRRAYGCIVLHRGVAHQGDDSVLGCRNGGCTGQIQVQL